SMNPSTAQILEAVEAAPADEVVVLPNNKNIIPVAEQVDELTAKKARVVPTTGVAEGFAALLDYDPQAPGAQNAKAMAESARLVQLAHEPVTKLAGVGPKKAESLKAMDIETVLDLVTTYPRRYLDRTAQRPIRDLTVGEEAGVLVTVKRSTSRRSRNGRSLVEV